MKNKNKKMISAMVFALCFQLILSISVLAGEADETKIPFTGKAVAPENIDEMPNVNGHDTPNTWIPEYDPEIMIGIDIGDDTVTSSDDIGNGIDINEEDTEYEPWVPSYDPTLMIGLQQENDAENRGSEKGQTSVLPLVGGIAGFVIISGALILYRTKK
jgi:hypothetical protein